MNRDPEPPVDHPRVGLAGFAFSARLSWPDRLRSLVGIPIDIRLEIDAPIMDIDGFTIRVGSDVAVKVEKK